MKKLITIGLILFINISFSQEKVIVFKDGIELKRGLYPRADMQPIDGLDPSLEIRIIVQDDYPVFDSSLQTATRLEVKDDTPHPLYPYLMQYKIYYQLSDIPVLDLESRVQGLEYQANNALFDNAKFQKYTILAVAILERKAKGLTITAKMQAVLDKVSEIALKVWQNEDVLNAKILELQNTGTTDFDTNWVKQ